MLKINMHSQGLMALKQMVVSQSSVVKGHTERLVLSFAISVLAAAGAILGSPIKAEADWTCSHTCPAKSCEVTCKDGQLCAKYCPVGDCYVACVA